MTGIGDHAGPDRCRPGAASSRNGIGRGHGGFGEPMAAEHTTAAGVTWTRPSEAVVLCLRRATVRTTAPVALVVGTILSVVNQGHLVFAGTTDATTWARVAVNYLVPFLVANTGFLTARRRRAAKAGQG